MRELTTKLKSAKTIKSLSDELLKASNEFFGIDIMRKTRKREYSQSRHLLMYYMYNNMKITHEMLSEIIGLNQSMMPYIKEKVLSLIEFDREFSSLAHSFFYYLDENVDLGSFGRERLSKTKHIRQRINNKLLNYSLTKLRKIDKILTY